MQSDLTMGEKQPRYGVRMAVPCGFFLLFFYFGRNYLGETDFSYVLRWWIMLLLLGAAFMPFCLSIFGKFRDCGWIFAKTLGIAFSGWLLWMLSSAREMKFTRENCLICALIMGVLGVVCFYFTTIRKKGRKVLGEIFTRERLCGIVSVEVIFFCMLVLWCYLKGISPDANGTERYMDYGYMLTMFKSEYMPPADMWFAGKSINYYYGGQYLMTYLTKLAGVPVTHGYNIAMMVVAAFGFALSYSIGNNLMHFYLEYRAKRTWTQGELASRKALGSVTSESGKPFFRPMISGLISAFAVSICGSMHYPIYKYIYPKLQELKEETKIYSYWFPDATRYIGYMPDVEDKTIHEFPVYSYVIGDLHAHVVNSIFVLTLLALLIAWLMNRKEQAEIVRNYGRTPKMPGLLKEVFRPELVACAFLIGLFHTTNYWDYPIYFVVCGAIILFTNLIIYRGKFRAWLLTACQAAMFIIVGMLVALPFTLTFDSISSKIGWCGAGHHTAQFQLMVLWGLPNLVVWSFIAYLFIRHENAKRLRKRKGYPDIPWELKDDVLAAEAENKSTVKSKNEKAKPKKNEEKSGKPEEGIGNPYTPKGIFHSIRAFLKDCAETFASVCKSVWKFLKEFAEDFGRVIYRPICRFFEQLELPYLYVFTIGLCAFGLVLLPEYIYVQDIYQGAYIRANTMFKLTYQAFIMFGLCMGFVITRFLTMANSRLMKFGGIVMFCLFATTIGYFNEAYTRWFNGFYQGLDATTFIGDDYNSADGEIVDYINENIDKQVNILEMQGLSYTYFNRISAFTGNPTILGWQTHEHLWRSSGSFEYPAEVTERSKDVIAIYTGKNVEKVCYLLEKYETDYVYIGMCEYVNGYIQLSDSTKDPNRLIGGKRYPEIDTNVELLLSLGTIEKEAIDKNGDSAYLIRLDREFTKAQAAAWAEKIASGEAKRIEEEEAAAKAAADAEATAAAEATEAAQRQEEEQWDEDQWYPESDDDAA